MNQVNKLIMLLIFIAGIGLGVVLKLLPANGATETKPLAPQPQPLKTSPAGEFRGIALQLHNGKNSHPYERFIDEIARTGANTLSLVVSGHQENGSSTSIFVDLRKTPSDDRIKALIAYAHKQNLRVVLMPIVLLENPREGEWRGKIDPTSWDEWWEDYTAFVIHYAKLAQKSGTEVLVIGSELVSTEKFTKRWRRFIQTLRWLYKGKLCYSANWDHYRPIEWWDDMDIIGMTSYYDLTGGDEPTVDRLLEAWKPIRKEILTWQKTIGRPIMFTEVGWPNQKTCAQFPWDYYRSPDSPDPQAQANCFEAFFRTWINEPSIAGFLVWEWRNDPDQKTGPDDPSYIPTDKPALAVISKYYQMPSPPATESTRTSGFSHFSHTQPATRPAPNSHQRSR